MLTRPTGIDINVDRISADTLKECLRMIGVNLRYNTRAQTVEAIGTGAYMRSQLEGNAGWRLQPDGWTKVDDLVDAFVRDELYTCVSLVNDDKSKPFKMTQPDWTLAVDAIAFANQVDPFKEWLRSLPQWDKKERIKQWLPRMVGATEGYSDAYCEAVMDMTLCGAVARAYYPGYVAPTLPILVGRGGVGKSRGVKALFPTEWQNHWFNEDFTCPADTKVFREETAGFVIVEWAEMAGKSLKMEYESVKAAITRTSDTARMAYARKATSLPRGFVIIGTANDDEEMGTLPVSDRGQRRFAPVRVGELDLTAQRAAHDWLDANREQLWAEAIVRFRKVYKPYGAVLMPEGLHSETLAHVEEHRQPASLEEAVADYIAEHPEMFAGKPLSRMLGEIANMGTANALSRSASVLLGKHPQSWSRQLGAALRDHDWSTKRNDRKRRWNPPGGAPVIDIGTTSELDKIWENPVT